jgi:hypothetical protein
MEMTIAIDAPPGVLEIKIWTCGFMAFTLVFDGENPLHVAGGK